MARVQNCHTMSRDDSLTAGDPSLLVITPVSEQLLKVLGFCALPLSKL